MGVVKGAGRLALRPESRWDSLHEWRRRLGGEPALPPGPVRTLLVICHGNICRSPFGATLLASRLPGREVRSAGLGAGDGDPATDTARSVSRRWSLSLEDHRSRPMTGADAEWADLILGMEGRHATQVARRWPGARERVRLLGHFLAAPPYGIRDPWGESEGVFEGTFQRIEQAVERLVSLLGEPEGGAGG
jgi:protein-tyrosine phosphatase